MTKSIFRIALAFIALNLVPILWLDKLEFNIATFTTALFFKSQTENISKAFETKKKNSELTVAILLFNNAISEKDIDTLKTSWLI